MSGTAVGGNDILTAGDGAVNFLIGDADNVSDRVICGNDTLISGTGTDYMWGDAPTINGSKVTTGADTFVFKPGSFADVIEDFRQSDGDKIDVSGYGFTDFASIQGDIRAVGSTTLINFGGSNNVELVNFTGTLTGADFIFNV
jgi:Ca2+-binding RTX toxin-like protein